MAVIEYLCNFFLDLTMWTHAGMPSYFCMILAWNMELPLTESYPKHGDGAQTMKQLVEIQPPWGENNSVYMLMKSLVVWGTKIWKITVSLLYSRPTSPSLPPSW